MPYAQQPEQESLYTAAQTRELDRITIEQFDTPGFELMKRAARAAYRALRQRWPESQRITVLCGPGNNGGDGLVLAGLALEHEQQVKVYLLGGDAPACLRGEARQAYDWAVQQGVEIEPYRDSVRLDADVLVDSLLGTGLQGPVRGDYVSVINQINDSAAPVLAIDIPSGLCSDSGAVLGTAVEAELTVSFIGLKRGLLTHQGVDHCGHLLFAPLAVPQAVYQQVPTSIHLIDQLLVDQALAPRPRSSHKGDFGHLLIVGGDRGMAGAVLMAAEAAARSGAGLVSVATRPEHVAGCNVRCPEVMAHGVRSGHDLQLLCERATVVLIGPGLGQSAWSGQLLQSVQQLSVPMVWDADALNFLSQGASSLEHRHDQRILTPHPGEAARLLKCDTAAIQADRFAAAKTLQSRFGGVVILKGAGTLVEDGADTRLCRHGNPGMASGGMGDVLSGITAGLLAQGLAPMTAACVAVQLHAQAADRQAAEAGERGLLATDLIAQLGRLLNPTGRPALKG